MARRSPSSRRWTRSAACVDPRATYTEGKQRASLLGGRIVLSGRFDAENYPALGSALTALGVGQAQFFVNSVNTRTKGIDLTVAHKADLGSAR